MAWFRVDDKLWGHQKWVGASPCARALWVTAGAWCSDHLTDGQIPKHMLAILGGRPKDAKELVELTLWDETKTGWAFGDWLDYQPSREQVLAEREAARQRQAKAREAAKLRREQEANKGVSHGVTSPELQGESRSPRPDPTRPDPTVVPTELPGEDSPSVSDAPKKPKASRLPDDWQPDLDLISWVRAECPDIDGRSVTENFRDYWHSKSRDAYRIDWRKVYRKWMRDEQSKAHRFSRPNATNGHRRSTTDDAVNQTLEMARRYAEEDAAAAANQPTRLGIAR